MNYKKIFTGLLFAIITIISTGCGESSFFDKADDTSSSSIMLHGNVAKGPIYKAEVRAFRLDTNKLLNTAQTDAKGDYSLDIGTYTGAIKVTAKGGSYIDEISGEEQDTTKLILEAISVISDDEKVKTVNITPVTDIAAQELEDMYEDIIKLAKKQSIITDVNINIARILTGSSFNPTKVKPKILGKDKIELNDGDAGEYGIFLAVFAKLSKSDVSNVKEKIEKFYNDIKDNSVLSEDSNTKIKDALEDDTIKKGINTDVITSIENQQKTYDVTPAISGTLIKTNQKIEGKTEFTLSVKDIDTKVLVHFKNKKSFATFEAKDENGKDIVFINNDSKITVTIINSDKFEETRKVILLIGKTEVLLSSTTTATVTIKDLKITSTATIKNTYKKDADINITVEFTKEIEVVLDENKKPSIVIKVGNADKLAYFKSFSGSDIIFTYKVKEGDNDINGISVPKSEITLNGATIKTTNGINTDNNYNTLEDNENHKVDAKVPTLTGVAITSNAGDNNTYGIGNTIIIEASFSENITSTDAKIIINITNDRTLSAESFTQEQISTGTNKLIFKYKVEKGDEDIDGISVHNLTGTIIDTVGNKVKDFTFEAITNNASHKITTATVTIKDLKITSTATIKNTYKKDADINITVEFTKEIEVVLDENKKPSIVIKVGNADKLAYFKSFSGSDIIFTYKVKEGDNDINGISVPKSEITLNGATIKTTNGINTDNNYNTLEDNENHKVDAKVPTLTGVAITSNAGDNNTYGIGNTIIIEASFSENITSTDAKIIINITNDRTLSAESFTQEQISTGTNKLIFKYKVEKGDEDIDGISVHNLTGTIIDTVGNKVKDFTFEAITNNASHKITTATVTIKDLKITSTATIKNTYKKDADINITVEFTKEIEVVLNDDKDKPHIVIKVGNADKLAYFKSFSGSDIIFTYKVKEGDNDINGISVPKSEITLNGATIKTTNGINTDNNYNTLEDNENHKVDAITPVLTFTNKNVVNSNFTITVTANKQMETLNVAKITANNGVTTNTEVTSSGNAYTISFVISSTTKEGDIVITFANGAIKDTYGNENNSVTVTIKYDITPPTLIFTSHQLISEDEALNLTLEGETNAENGQKVHLSIGKEVLGTATVIAGDWTKENIKVIDKGIEKSYTGTDPLVTYEAQDNYSTINKTGYGDLKHLFDGNTKYSESTATDIVKGIGKAFTITFRSPQVIKSIDIWGGNSSRNRNYAYNAKWDFYDANEAIVESIQIDKYDKDWYYKVSPDTSTLIQKIIVTKTTDTYLSFSEMKIHNTNLNSTNPTITAKVKDEAGNETSKDFNLEIVYSFTFLSDSVKNNGVLDEKYAYNMYGNKKNRKNISPQLKWGGAPVDTKSYAIIMDRPKLFPLIHWNVLNIPKSVTSFKEGWSSTHDNADDGIIERAGPFHGLEDRYVGPWHGTSISTYYIKIYALNIETLGNSTSARDRKEFESTYGKKGSNNILGSTTLTFTFTP